MNAERRIQRVRAALHPIGSSRPDWQIVSEIARTMGGRGFAFASPEDIWNEVRTLCDGARGNVGRQARRGRSPMAVPHRTASRHADSALRHIRARTPCSAANSRVHRETSEVVTPEYPLTLITGRSLYQFNAGTMTGRTPNTELRFSDVLDVSPADAGRLGLDDGRMVRVTSRYGSATLPLRINTTVNPDSSSQPFRHRAYSSTR